MTNDTANTPSRRIDDQLPGRPLQWEDQPEAVRQEHAKTSACLANELAGAGAAFLAHVGTGGGIAAIPNTGPAQYVVVGTMAAIRQVLGEQTQIPVPRGGGITPVTTLTGEQLHEFYVKARGGVDEGLVAVANAAIAASLASQSQAAQPTDERAQFEQHYRALVDARRLHGLDFARTPAGNYDHAYVGAYWHGWQARAHIAGTSQATNAQAEPTDDQIEQAALKHVATGWEQLAAVAKLDPDYRKCEQFKRLKAFALELFAAAPVATGVETGSVQANLERIAQSWDGCEGEGIRDIGEALREEFKQIVAAPIAKEAPKLPDILFDGFSVYAEMDQKAHTRTSADNVSDVLDAVARLIRRGEPVAKEAEKEQQALRKLCDQIDNEKRRLRPTPGTGQNHSYLLAEDVDAYVEEARKSLAPTTQQAAKAETAEQAERVSDLARKFFSAYPSTLDGYHVDGDPVGKQLAEAVRELGSANVIPRKSKKENPVGMVVKATFGDHKIIVATARLDNVEIGTKVYRAPTTSTVSASTPSIADDEHFYVMLKDYRAAEHAGSNRWRAIVDRIDTYFAPFLAAQSSTEGAQAAPEEVRNQALEEAMIARRIAVTPEYEGGFHAEEYGSSEVPSAHGYGETPSAAIRALKRTSTDQANADTDTGSAA